MTTGMKPGALGIRDLWETCVRDLDRPRGNDRLPVDTSDALASGFLAADFAGYLSGCLSGPCAIGGGTTRDGDQFHWDEASHDSCGAILDGFATVGSPGRRAEEWRHHVTLTASFYLGVHQVTQEQYVRVMKQNPSEFARDGVQGARVMEQATECFPVDSVNWNQAVQFCLRLSELPKECSADRSYRLPTEAEWEYAARAGTDTVWSFGRHQEQLFRHVWYRRSSDRLPHTVAEKRPNAWGLYDMYGNVWEWCLDWPAAAYYHVSPSQDPTGPTRGDTRVLRGRGWASVAARCRSASSVGDPPSVGDPDTGFRVLMLKPGKPPRSSR